MIKIDYSSVSKSEVIAYLQNKLFGSPEALKCTILEDIYRVSQGGNIVTVLKWYENVEKAYNNI